MSQEFTLEEFSPFNWQDSCSIKTQKNMNFTMSQASKNDSYLHFYTPIQEPTWDLRQFNKKAEKRERNKHNVRKFRERKKLEEEKIQSKIRHLQEQNNLLKKQKYCPHCQRTYDPWIQVCSDHQTQKEKPKQATTQKQSKIFLQRNKQSQHLQFQQFSLKKTPKKQDNSISGKIWVALGILMLVLGLHLYGFDGKDDYKQISISKIQTQKWAKSLEGSQNSSSMEIEQKHEGSKSFEDYFNVKMKIKDQKDQKKDITEKKQHNIFKQIRIFHEQFQNSRESQKGNSARLKQFKQVTSQTLKGLQRLQQNGESQGKLLESGSQEEELFSFHKQLLFAIQAEIEDVGNYL